ncbi:response regulator receiver protein [Sulfurospirillum sp. SCADC]|nr:response regulator receiver protein [Sulfurospirillum sp. SCADC]
MGEPRIGSILLIDCSQMFSKMLQRELKALGYPVRHVSTLHAAIELLTFFSFDLIIVDLSLPDGEGEMILQNLHIFGNPKIFIYTSDATATLHETWSEYGVLGSLCKTSALPVVMKEIHKTMKTLLYNTLYSILVVDDSPISAQYLQTILRPHHYDVEIAYDQATAQKLLCITAFDLIIVDASALNSLGASLLVQFRNMKQSMHIPIFMLTEHYDAHTIRKHIQQGANEFFHKPFIEEELLLKVNFWIDFGRKTKENSYQRTVLHEYKNAIDRSTIVSKTNKEGIITYANDKFCHISGYRYEELIGRPHSIVRHPSMPKEIFKQMWETILKGERWEGVVKNRRKDGSAYWVNAVINPIIDNDGTIIEFISIRTDISSVHEIHDSLQNQLKISEKNFEDAYHMFKQYEHAINESTILTRTDLEGNITFANENFYKTTGFSEDEVIGKNHNIIRHKDTPNEVFADLWRTLKEGNVWRGVFKNQRKDGNASWVYSTILPICNKHNIPLEYMAIRRDITEIINLHEELEATQQEVIYRMGEIAESRSKETGNHVRRVAAYSRLLALKYGLDKKESDLIGSASPMHDIGKVGIPDSILQKPGPLSDEEWEIMRTHAMLGYTILQNSTRPLLQAAAIIAKEHHEKYDGTGYPLNLKGRDIHLYARIVAVADVFDALSHDRCYKKAWEDAAVFEFFEHERGKHFDPQIVDLFLSAKEDFLAIRDSLKDSINYAI